MKWLTESGGSYPINLTYDEEDNPSIDKTYNEIVSAVEDGLLPKLYDHSESPSKFIFNVYSPRLEAILFYKFSPQVVSSGIIGLDINVLIITSSNELVSFTREISLVNEE